MLFLCRPPLRCRPRLPAALRTLLLPLPRHRLRVRLEQETLWNIVVIVHLLPARFMEPSWSSAVGGRRVLSRLLACRTLGSLLIASIVRAFEQQLIGVCVILIIMECSSGASGRRPLRFEVDVAVRLASTGVKEGDVSLRRR